MCSRFHQYYKKGSPTAGVTGKGGIWREKPPDAESAVWGRYPESAGECPHLSGARGVGPLSEFTDELPTPKAAYERQPIHLDLLRPC